MKEEASRKQVKMLRVAEETKRIKKRGKKVVVVVQLPNRKGAICTTNLEMMFSGFLPLPLGFAAETIFLQALFECGKTSTGQSKSVSGPTVAL